MRKGKIRGCVDVLHLEHTFNETGKFGLSIKGESDLKGTIVVKTVKTQEV